MSRSIKSRIQKTIRLPPDLLDQINEYCKQNDLAFNDCIIELLRNSVEQDLSEILKTKLGKIKLMKAPFDVRCSLHKELFGEEYTIKKGENVLWIPDTNINICSHCLRKLIMDSVQDKDLIKLSKKIINDYREYLKWGSLKREIKKEVEGYMRYMNLGEAIKKIHSIEKTVIALLSNPDSDHDTIRELFNELEEIRGLLLSVREKIRDICQNEELRNSLRVDDYEL